MTFPKYGRLVPLWHIILSTYRQIVLLLLLSFLLGGQTSLACEGEWPTYCETAGEVSVMLSEDHRKLDVDANLFCVSSPIIAAYLQVATDEGLFKASIDLTPFAEGREIRGAVDPRAYLDELLDGKVYLEIMTLNDIDGKYIGKLRVTDESIPNSAELYSVNLLEQRNQAGLNVPIELRINTMDNFLSPIILMEESDSPFLKMAPIAD